MGPLRKWMVIAVALITTVVVIGVVMPSFSLIAPHWATSFEASTGAIMMATTLTQIGAGLLAPLAGYAVGRVPVRTLMVLGVVLSSGALALVGLATAMWQVTVLHALVLSAGIILCGPLVTQVLAVRLFQNNRGLAIGVVTAGAPICTFTMPPLIGALLEQFDWRTVEFMMAGLILMLAPLILLVVRETPAAVQSNDAPEHIPEPTLTAGHILSSWMFWGVLMTVIPLNLVFNAIYYNIGFHLRDLGYGPAETATMISVIGLVSLPAVLAYGVLADRVAHWPLLAGTIALACAVSIVSAMTQDYSVLLIMLSLMGFCVGGLMPLLVAIFARRYGTANFAQANGLLSPFVTVTAFSPMLAGFGRDALGSYSAVFTMLLASLPLCAVGLAMMRIPNRAAIDTTPAQSLGDRDRGATVPA